MHTLRKQTLYFGLLLAGILLLVPETVWGEKKNCTYEGLSQRDGAKLCRDNKVYQCVSGVFVLKSAETCDGYCALGGKYKNIMVKTYCRQVAPYELYICDRGSLSWDRGKYCTWLKKKPTRPTGTCSLAGYIYRPGIRIYHPLTQRRITCAAGKWIVKRSSVNLKKLCTYQSGKYHNRARICSGGKVSECISYTVSSRWRKFRSKNCSGYSGCSYQYYTYTDKALLSGAKLVTKSYNHNDLLALDHRMIRCNDGAWVVAPSPVGKKLHSMKHLKLNINAWGGAKQGTTLRLHGSCPASNPDCKWVFLPDGRIASATNRNLYIHAWGGAKQGATLRLSNNCLLSNSNCKWSVLSDGRIASVTQPNLYIHAWGGAKHGTTLRLNKNCTASNPDCRWLTSNGVSNNQRSGITLQPHWRWCHKCSGMFYLASKVTYGRCPAGGAHNASRSGHYHVPHGQGIMQCTQPHWRWCHKCSGLFYSANKTTFGRCPAGGAHDATKSGHYHPPHGSAQCKGGAQVHWRWCHKCSGLFYSANKATFGRCPAGGTHDATKSGHYFGSLQ